MIINNFITAKRNIGKTKSFSAINVAGLAAGLCFQDINAAIANPLKSLKPE